MVFADFEALLKEYFAESISDEDLCNLLFTEVVHQGNVKNKTGESYYFSKDIVSRILTGQRSIPKKLVLTIQHQDVQERLLEFFSKHILQKLNPEHAELINKLLILSDNEENISASEHQMLHMMAHQRYEDAFLTSIFVWSVKLTDKIEKKDELPLVRLVSLAADDSVCDDLQMTAFAEQNDITSQKIFDELKILFQKVNDLDFSIYPSQIVIAGAIEPFASKVKISDSEQDNIKTFADTYQIALNADFFDLGNLRRNEPMMTAFPKKAELTGTKKEKEKYQLIDKISDKIYQYTKCFAIEHVFQDCKMIRLAVRNETTKYQDGLQLALIFSKNTLFSCEDLRIVSRKTWEAIFRTTDVDDVFEIPRKRNSLDYYESRRHAEFSSKQILPIDLFYGKSDEEYYSELWQEIFPYECFEDDTNVCLQLNFDEIQQHNTVTFPTVLLLKKSINEIPYTLKGRNLEDEIHGKLCVEEKSE